MALKKNTPKPEEAETKNWYKDRYQSALVWRNILAVLTLISLAISLVSVVAVKQLAPLKTVEPFVIQVEDKTGITQVVDPLTDKELTANEAIKNFFVIQYVRARETYDVADLQYNYNIVRVMSDPEQVYPTFLRANSANNPESNVSRLGTEGQRIVKFKSIAYIDSQTAQVRVLIEEHKGNDVNLYHKVALVAFKYVKLDLTPEERNINPLGFIVTNYRLDEDTLQQ